MPLDLCLLQLLAAKMVPKVLEAQRAMKLFNVYSGRICVSLAERLAFPPELANFLV